MAIKNSAKSNFLRKVEVRWVWKHFLVSQRRSRELMNMAESSQRYASQKNYGVLRTKLVEAVPGQRIQEHLGKEVRRFGWVDESGRRGVQ